MDTFNLSILLHLLANSSIYLGFFFLSKPFFTLNVDEFDDSPEISVPINYSDVHNTVSRRETIHLSFRKPWEREIASLMVGKNPEAHAAIKFALTFSDIPYLRLYSAVSWKKRMTAAKTLE